MIDDAKPDGVGGAQMRQEAHRRCQLETNELQTLNGLSKFPFSISETCLNPSNGIPRTLFLAQWRGGWRQVRGFNKGSKGDKVEISSSTANV